MRVINTLLAIALMTGLALSLPIWWWLFVEPFVEGWKRLFAVRRPAAAPLGEVGSTPEGQNLTAETKPQPDRALVS